GKDYGGKKFRLEAAVKTKLQDKNAFAALWFRVDKANKKMGFFNNMFDKPIRSDKWSTYSISGKIDKDAAYLNFGGLYYNKGLFYFDDFKFFIEDQAGIMKEVDLPNGGFEGDTTQFKNTWHVATTKFGYKVSLTTKDFYQGKASCLVDGTNITKGNEYGSNDSAGNFALVNGINIYYETYGEGAPLFLLHGNSSSISLFAKQIPELSKYFKVYAIDTRGQGKSGEDGKKYTYDLFAEDMNALVQHLKLDSVHVLGWSDGGNTGLIMAMRYPASIRRLVTMGANVFINHTVVDNWVFKILNKEKKELQGDTAYLRVNRLRLIDLLLTEPKHNFKELNSIKIPVLVIAGEKDVIKSGHTKSIAANISNSTLWIAEKETHYFPSENPALFNKRVIEFLAK
ncbi:MAG: alpha/beta hydrolase, partial [Ferruginibacter sp.]